VKGDLIKGRAISVAVALCKELGRSIDTSVTDMIKSAFETCLQPGIDCFLQNTVIEHVYMQNFSKIHSDADLFVSANVSDIKTVG
jgi:hypothetical protein